MKRAWQIAPLGLLVLLGAASLAFDLTLSRSLPSQADWAEAAGALRARAQPGDALQVWPYWAERARLVIDAVPVFTEEDLLRADYVGVSRLWLLALEDAPRAGVRRAREALRSRGATPLADPQRFGALTLQPWELHAPPMAADLTPLLSGKSEWREVDYVGRRCHALPIGGRVQARDVEAGATLHVRAGIIGDKAYDRALPPVEVLVEGGARASLTVNPVVEPTPAWQGLDVAVPPGEPRRTFEFRVQSAQAGDRRVCVAAWTTR